MSIETQLCEKCQQKEATNYHPCPYKSDVNDDSEFRCNCCEDCTAECAADI